jgi:hypothetical protein
MSTPEADHAMALIGTLSCTAQVDSQVLSFITRLWPRRLAVVDEQRGLVFSLPMFQHRGAVRTIKIQGVPGVETIAMGGGSSNLQAGEIFKILGGKIHDIEAMGVGLPYGTKSGWE